MWGHGEEGSHRPEEGYKTISKRFRLCPSTGKKKTLYKLRAFNMTATLPRSGRPSKLSTRSTTKIQNQIKGNEHITSRVLQTFLLPSGTKASAAIIWRAMPFPGEWVEGSLCSQKRTKLPCFNLPREHLGKPEAFWKSILWTDVSTRIIWLQSKTSILGEQNLPPTVKHDGGDVKVWVCSSASAPEPPFLQGTMNCPAYHQSPAISQGGGAGMSVDYVSRQWPETFPPSYSGTGPGTLDRPSQSQDLSPGQMFGRCCFVPPTSQLFGWSNGCKRRVHVKVSLFVN